MLPSLNFWKISNCLNYAPATVSAESSQETSQSGAKAAKEWAEAQDDDRLKLEALWISWGADRLNKDLLLELLRSKDHRVRTASVQVLRNNLFNFDNELVLLRKAAYYSHGRVRLAAATTASYLPQTDGLSLIDKVREKGINPPFTSSLDDAERALQSSSETWGG